MNRSAIATVLVALLVTLAGCGSTGIDLGGNDDGAGDSGGNGDANDGGNGGAADGGNGNGAADGGNGDGANAGGSSDMGDISPGTVNFFEFESPGRYVFDVEIEGEGSGQAIWDIQEIDGEQLTVYVNYDVGEDVYESTITGTKDEIQGQLMFSPAGSFMILTLLSPSMTYWDGEELRVGKQWSFSSPEGSMSLAVTGTDSYAGISCFVSELQINETVIHEGCFSPDLGLAPFTAFYNEDDGSVEMRMELVEYSPN